MCLVHNVKKIVKRVLDGIVSLPRKYKKAEGTVWVYGEERKQQLTLVGAQV
jgi:hypothetical protein